MLKFLGWPPVHQLNALSRQLSPQRCREIALARSIASNRTTISKAVIVEDINYL
jgi:hypothetical protein